MPKRPPTPSSPAACATPSSPSARRASSSRTRSCKAHVPAVNAGKVLETTGAGDAFNGGFAVALSEGMDLVAAARFGCATAGISVTRAGTAPSMPTRAEIDALLK